MSRRPPDHELRRLVAELATATTEDLEAVLEGLEPPQRRRVSELLAVYVGGEPELKPTAQPRAAKPAPPRLRGLSPWLAWRLRQGERGPAEGRTGGGAWPGPPPGGRVVAMTPAALKALTACALALAPPTSPSKPLLARLGHITRRGGGA